MDAKLGFK